MIIKNTTVSSKGSTPPTVVFDFSDDLYGRELEVEFIAHLRDEVRFESVEVMVLQMQVDAREARKWVDET